MIIPFIVVQYDLYNHFCWLNNFGYRHDWMSMLCESLSHLRYWDHHPISMFEHQKTNVYICLPPKWFLLYGKTKTVYPHDRNIFPGNSPRPSASWRSRRSLPWTPSSWAAMGQLSHGKHMENVWKTYGNVYIYICIYVENNHNPNIYDLCSYDMLWFLRQCKQEMDIDMPGSF